MININFNFIHTFYFFDTTIRLLCAWCKKGDGALKVVKHPIAGKCLVARFHLPAKYKIVFHGKRGPCRKEDRAISYYPPHKDTGRNTDSYGNMSVNYNGVSLFHFLFQ